MQEFIEHVNTLSRINFFFFFILLNRIWKKYFYQIQTISSFIKLHVSKIKIKQLPNPYFFRSDELSFSPLQNHDYPRKTTNAWKDKMSGETNCQFIDKPNRQYVQLHDSLFLHVKKKKHAIITNLIEWYPKKKKKKNDRDLKIGWQIRVRLSQSRLNYFHVRAKRRRALNSALGASMDRKGSVESRPVTFIRCEAGYWNIFNGDKQPFVSNLSTVVSFSRPRSSRSEGVVPHIFLPSWEEWTRMHGNTKRSDECVHR